MVSLRDDNLPYLASADFERLLAEGQLSEALGLYHGDFLEGFHLLSSPAFETWAASERERLRDLALGTYQELTVQYAARGQTEEAIRLARGLLRLEPLHEPTQRLLLRLLARSGRRLAAIEGFESYRKLLQAELKLEPDRETLALLKRVKGGLEEGVPQAERPLTPSPAPLCNFPLTSAALLGRQAELAALRTRLLTADCRLVTLTAPGGMGKARLALAAALQASPSFPDGVCFVPLAGVLSAEAIVPAVVQSMELTLSPSSAPKAGLLAYLRNKKMLLVLEGSRYACKN